MVLAGEVAGHLFSGRAPFLALPLHSVEAQDQGPGGLLLARPVSVNHAELEWVSEYLGYRSSARASGRRASRPSGASAGTGTSSTASSTG